MNYCKDRSVNFMSVLCMASFLSIWSYKYKYLPDLRAAAIKRAGILSEWGIGQNCDFAPVNNNTSNFHSYLTLAVEALVKQHQIYSDRNKLAVLANNFSNIIYSQSE